MTELEFAIASVAEVTRLERLKPKPYVGPKTLGGTRPFAIVRRAEVLARLDRRT